MNKYFEKIKSESPNIANILNESKSLEELRKKIFNYLKDLEWEYREGVKT